MDERIRNWSYIGPISSKKEHDEILNQVLESGIGSESVFNHNGTTYSILNANTSSDANTVSQIFKEIKEDDYIIGFASLFSNQNTEIAVKSWFHQIKEKLVYLNGKEIQELSEKSKVIFKRKIEDQYRD